MDTHDELSFMDLLDLDEEIVDSRLKNIMLRKTHTKQHLANALHLLKYKHLINIQEDAECENEEECIFIAKLMKNVNEENIDYVCKIVNLVLELNKTTLISKSQHFLQQILSNIDLLFQKANHLETDEESSIKSLLNFKLCDSILDVVIKSGQKLHLPYLGTPLENVLLCYNEKVTVYFLNNTVPRLFEGVTGYNILDRIWNYINCAENKDNTLKILSCLSEFYLPIPDDEGNTKYESLVLFKCEFWSILLYGLLSSDPSTRKISLYLIKRAIDCVTTLKRDVIINTETGTVFRWLKNNEKSLKGNWNNFFILIDSLQEKQSNIVLPSLKLLETIQYIPTCWLNCAFNIGLKHDNTQVRLKCIDYRLKTKLEHVKNTAVLLEALNDINLYDSEKYCEDIKRGMSRTMKDPSNLMMIIKAICNIKWSPVPLYHITDALAQQTTDLSAILTTSEFCKLMIDIIKLPCTNKVIRHAVKINMTYFIAQCYKCLEWRDLMNIFLLVKFHSVSQEVKDKNPLIHNIKNINLTSNEKQDFFNNIAASHANIDFGLLYLENHVNDLNIFIHLVQEKVEIIKDITKRQYSNKVECFSEVLFIIYLFNKTENHNLYKQNIASILFKECKTISCYLYGLLQSDDINLSIDEIVLLFKGFNSMALLGENEAKVYLYNIYQPLTLLLQDENINLTQKLFAVYYIAEITDLMVEHNNQHNMIHFKELLSLFNSTSFKEIANVNDIGRLKNSFTEKYCEIIYRCITLHRTNENTILTVDNLNKLIDYVENVIDSGYGCLRWILKIVNIILPEILDNANIKFDTLKFITRIWKEIEELKSNNQYCPCIELFVELITQDQLLNKTVYGNVIQPFYSKIIEYGTLKNDPLYYLVRELNKKIINDDYEHLIYDLTEILLFSPVSKKDQRIAENLVIEISKTPRYGCNSKGIDSHFNYIIQYMAVMVMSKIKSPEILEAIACRIINRLEDNFRNKLRYHGNSQSHRLLFVGLQHLLYLNALGFNKSIATKARFDWAVEFLGRLPHQPSVRVCLEWYITNVLCLKVTNVNRSIVHMLESKNVPLISQFMIIYWMLKNRIKSKLYTEEEYEFVMDFLLPHTMGQMFNIRLLAQYLTTELYKAVPVREEKYAYILEVIGKSFIKSANEKSLIKLQGDYFIKHFDPVQHLTPSFIYYFLPRYYDVNDNEKLDDDYIKHVLKKILQYTIQRQDCYDDLNWIDEEVFAFNFSRTSKHEINCTAYEDAQTTIQKKYIPWKNMTDIEVCGMGKKMQSSSELIVVASLIDKLPNLGGMARTSEVFGVKTYVVDSLRYLQDKQFQGLSVSAERWVNIEEVRPGQPLKDYLIKKKYEGYCIVAAEQTSSSVQLQNFRFSKRTLLLLGHEKEGVSCDLLPIMDHCVEIPQQGFVRSLNVHVTAAVFIWEYTRQNIL